MAFRCCIICFWTDGFVISFLINLWCPCNIAHTFLGYYLSFFRMFNLWWCCKCMDLSKNSYEIGFHLDAIFVFRANQKMDSRRKYMIQLRVIKRIQPNFVFCYVIQKKVMTGLFFQNILWKDCSGWDLTFSDDTVDKFIFKYPRTNKFTTEKSARDHFCYFDGTKSTDIIL